MWIRGLIILILAIIVFIVRKKNKNSKRSHEIENWEKYFEKDEHGKYPWENDNRKENE